MGKGEVKIAWIDDDTDIIDPVVEPLEEAGYTIERFRTIEAALGAINYLETSDLILLDMILPPGDLDEDFGRYSGVALLRKLREIHGVATPVVVFSVVDMKKVIEQLKPLGIGGYVRKPALPSELKDAVDAVLELKGPRASKNPTPDSP